jgi:protein TonB
MMKRLRSLHRKKERRPAALFVSVGVHVLVFIAVFIAARKMAQVAVKQPAILTFRAPPPPPPPPPAGGQHRQHVEKKIERIEPQKPVIPVEIPKEQPKPPEPEPEPEQPDEPEEPQGVEGGVEGGVVGGVIGGVVGGVVGGVLGNPLPPEDDWDPSQAHEITVGVTPPRLVKKQPPQYPVPAMRRKIEGEVVLRCIITESGDVRVNEIVQAPDMLADAAKDAVEHWKYEPAVYKDHPQAVFLLVRINFKLPR